VDNLDYFAFVSVPLSVRWLWWKISGFPEIKFLLQSTWLKSGKQDVMEFSVEEKLGVTRTYLGKTTARNLQDTKPRQDCT